MWRQRYTKAADATKKTHFLIYLALYLNIFFALKLNSVLKITLFLLLREINAAISIYAIHVLTGKTE